LEAGHVLDVDTGIRRKKPTDRMGRRLHGEYPRSGSRTSNLILSSADFHSAGRAMADLHRGSQIRHACPRRISAHRVGHWR